MAILQRTALYPQMRFDVPDARAIEAFSQNDWKYFLRGILSEKSLIVAGFEITNYQNIFTVPGVKLQLNDVALIHSEAQTQALGFYVSAGSEPDFNLVLNPNATNFVELDLGDAAGSPDVRAFWDPGANGGKGGEFTDTVDTVINLNLNVLVNVSGFSSGRIPLYKIITNSQGVVTQLIDCRPLFFRLGTGGSSPDPNSTFAFPSVPDADHARLEAPISASSATLSNPPFQGGDKNIKSLKEWLDVVMTSIRELKGTPYWYMATPAGGGIPAAYQNAALIVLEGGTWQHLQTSNGHLALAGNSVLTRLGMTNAVILNGFSDVDLTTHRTLFIILPNQDTPVAYGFGGNGTSPVVPQAVQTVTSSSLVVGPGGNYVTGSGRILVRGQEFRYNSYTSSSGTFLGVTPDPSGLVQNDDLVYQSNSGGNGYYHVSPPANVPGVIGSVSAGAERTLWLALFDDVNTIQLRNGDIEQGEQIQVSDNTTLNVLTYIGSPSEPATNPNYATDAIGSKTGQSQYNSVPGESLTVRASRLTSMMADKAQDKTIGLLATGFSKYTNTANTSLGTQDLTFLGGGSLAISIPSSGSVGTIGLSGTLSLGLNQAAYFSVDRNNAFSVANLSSLSVGAIGAVPLNESTYIFAYRLSGSEVYLWDGTVIPLGTLPTAFTLTTDVRQNLNLKLIEGGTWSWTLGTKTLAWSLSAFVQIPELQDSSNTILAGSVTLNDGDVAYVSLNRVTSGISNLPVATSPVASLSLTDEICILARRKGNDVYVGSHGAFRLTDGESKKLDEAISIQNRAFIGATGEADSAPNYSGASGSSVANRFVIDAEKLTLGIKRLDNRAGFQADIASADRNLKLIKGGVWSYSQTPGVNAVQNLSFASVPTAGSFALQQGANTTSLIPYNATALSIQNALAALPGLSGIQVSGSFATSFTITFGTPGPQALLAVVSNTLTGTSSSPTTPYSQLGYTPGNEVHINGGPTTKFAQRFTLSNPTQMTQLRYSGGRFGGAVTGNAVLTLVADNGGLPTGAAYDSASQPASNVPVGVIGDFIFNISSPTTLAPGNYWAVLDFSAVNTAGDDLQFVTQPPANNSKTFTSGSWINAPGQFRGLFSGNAQVSSADPGTITNVTTGIAPGPAVLSFTADAFLQVPGLPDSLNTIPFNTQSPVSLNDGDVAYVSINRFGSGSQNLTVTKGPVGSITLTDNLVVIARRVGSDVLVGSHTFRLTTGQSKELDAGLSIQNRTLLGSGITESTSNPVYSSRGAPNRTIGDGQGFADAIASIDNQIDKFFGQLRLKSHPTNPSRVIVAGSDFTLLDGSTLSQEISSLVMNFTGAVIDFSTGAVLKSDGVTSLGFNFTPPSVPSGQFLWYSITVVAAAVESDGRISAQVFVNPASGSGATAALAPNPAFVPGKKIGAVQVQNTSGTISQIAIRQLGVGSGSAGSGSGSGASKQPADGYQSLIFDVFDTLPTDSTSTVLTSNSNAKYDVLKRLYKLLCDKAVAITTTGTNFTLSASPSYTIAPGDILYSSGTWRKIATLSTQTAGTLDAAFPTNLGSAAGMVSQALWTQDLVNFGDPVQKSRPRDFFPNTDITACHIDYFDSLASGDDVPDFVEPACVVVSGCNRGLQSDTFIPTSDLFTSIFSRPQAPSKIPDYPLAATTSTHQRLFLVFFPNPNNGTVTSSANLIEYDLSLYPVTLLQAGGYLQSSFCMSDSSGAPINCQNPTVIGGQTYITLSYNFVPGINSGTTRGDLTVEVDGRDVPRRVIGSTQDAWWEEVPGSINQIRFWANLSSLSWSIETFIRQGSVDTSSQNTTRLAALQEAIVGSAAQVASGQATHSSWQAAHDAVSAGAKILVLQGVYAESPIISKEVFIEGKGHSCVLSGNLTLQSGATFGSILWVKFGGNITVQSGANKIFLRGWQANGMAFNNSGTDIDHVIITE